MYNAFCKQLVPRVSVETKNQKLKVASGNVPKDLRGTYFRNGPGLLQRKNVISHFFDGDGMIFKVKFDDTGVYMSNKFIETDKFLKEERADTFLEQGVFSSLNFRPTNVSNTNVVLSNGLLYSLYDAGNPYILDPETLETIEMSSMGVTSAHYRRYNDNIIHFGSIITGNDCVIEVRELDSDMKQVNKCKVKLKDAALGFFHDILVTEDYYIVLENPTQLNMMELFHKETIMECVEVKKGNYIRIHLIPRKLTRKTYTKVRVKTIDTNIYGFTFHHVNAHSENGNLHIDTCIYPTFDFTPIVCPPNGAKTIKPQISNLCRISIYRATINNTILQEGCEFPCVHKADVGNKYKHVYTLGGYHDSTHNMAWYQSIKRVNVKTKDVDEWKAGALQFPGEPVLVETENNAYLLVYVFDSNLNKTSLNVLDASDITKGPVCVIDMPFVLPLGLHGSFSTYL